MIRNMLGDFDGDDDDDDDDDDDVDQPDQLAF